ncbi:uncharacterized protein HMPREF1541_02880 [Cyphellophora europaea CBS 101466]|uniref:Phosphoglycerate mutase n=1 Tax=Cyphellophora europaea (strain CBS 101466) TaxID=1220924 RepID=W2S4U7_CYPE1|nr:uncharacterized protein HMPREF1541_02880 [Cyphellophora europaea CBS 101466]ETN43721.1 hypothetical protein HMPREF1541_02880 [Cyphellophora europaea CBS 101466]
MHLLLIRHGETEHNVAGLLAGATDSKLTNHGILQAQRLGKFIASTRKLQLTQIFSSDLQRAWMTAAEVCKSQLAEHGPNSALDEVIKLPLLREQDFGSLELVPWASKRADDAFTTKVPSATDPDFKPKETAEQMQVRADQFLTDFLHPVLALGSNEQVAIVSHGLFLSSLWRALLRRFPSHNITIGPDVGPLGPSRPLEYIGSWSNTGYLELAIHDRCQQDGDEHSQLHPSSPATFTGFGLNVLAINRKDHLENLKRTRGVGSAAYDARQQQIDGFFKRPTT